jgi:hypothetical protein
MSGFKLEERYIVVKKKRLNSDQISAVHAVVDAIGDEELGCVVIEDDWPEYDTVVQMLADRAEGRPNHLTIVTAQSDDLLAALKLYEQAFDRMFAQCCSNGMKDAWGKPVDCTLLNHAHYAAGKAIANAQVSQSDL